MKLRNKKTGEIVETMWWDEEVDELCIDGDKLYFYNSLAELNEEWEDYEEPKEYWYIYADSPKSANCGNILEEDFEAIGNYFETKEEAEKTVEKLKAWKRLKDKGFRFTGHFLGTEGLNIHYECDMKNDISDDLDLLFGGEK